jgi:hypothetical protein
MPDKIEVITHVLKVSDRTFQLLIREKPRLIEVDFLVDKYGDLQEAEAAAKWMLACLAKYDDDPRPLAILHPDSGERCILTGPGKQTFTFITTINPEQS